MRYAILLPILGAVWSAPAQAGLLDQAQFEPSRFLPPSPAQDSVQTQDEMAELKARFDSGNRGTLKWLRFSWRTAEGRA